MRIKRSETVQIRLTKAELRQFRQAAAGIPLSVFGRFRLLGAALAVPAVSGSPKGPNASVAPSNAVLRPDSGDRSVARMPNVDIMVHRTYTKPEETA